MIQKQQEPGEEKSLIIEKEALIAKIQEMNLLSNVFMSVALNDKEACQYVLRRLLGMNDLVVKEVRSP